MEKPFSQWNYLKQELDDSKRLPTFNEREVWWCSIGVNVGFEVFGEGHGFWRPVLLLNKHNRHTFHGLPLGSTVKPGSRHHFYLEFNDRPGSVMLSQGRTMSSKRLSNIMGTLPESTFESIRDAYRELV